MWIYVWATLIGVNLDLLADLWRVWLRTRAETREARTEPT